MTRLTWRLEMVDWNGIESGLYGGDRFCNTRVERFFALSEVWEYLGFRLKKARFGYCGLKDNKEYILTRM